MKKDALGGMDNERTTQHPAASRGHDRTRRLALYPCNGPLRVGLVRPGSRGPDLASAGAAWGVDQGAVGACGRVDCRLAGAAGHGLVGLDGAGRPRVSEGAGKCFTRLSMENHRQGAASAAWLSGVHPTGDDLMGV